MRNARVVDTLDTGVAVWVQVARANGDTICGFVERTNFTRSISPRDFVSIFGRKAVWHPRVDPANSYDVGEWANAPSNKRPILQKAPHLLMP